VFHEQLRILVEGTVVGVWVKNKLRVGQLLLEDVEFIVGIMTSLLPCTINVGRRISFRWPWAAFATHNMVADCFKPPRAETQLGTHSAATGAGAGSVAPITFCRGRKLAAISAITVTARDHMKVWPKARPRAGSTSA
jgi:hypothetical protein